MRVRMTESLRQYVWKFHREKYPLILLGHVELLEEFWGDYIEWCQTPEGASYLEGGANYKDAR